MSRDVLTTTTHSASGTPVASNELAPSASISLGLAKTVHSHAIEIKDASGALLVLKEAKGALAEIDKQRQALGANYQKLSERDRSLILAAREDLTLKVLALSAYEATDKNSPQVAQSVKRYASDLSRIREEGLARPLSAVESRAIERVEARALRDTFERAGDFKNTATHSLQYALHVVDPSGLKIVTAQDFNSQRTSFNASSADILVGGYSRLNADGRNETYKSFAHAARGALEAGNIQSFRKIESALEALSLFEQSEFRKHTLSGDVVNEHVALLKTLRTQARLQAGGDDSALLKDIVPLRNAILKLPPSENSLSALTQVVSQEMLLRSTMSAEDLSQAQRVTELRKTLEKYPSHFSTEGVANLKLQEADVLLRSGKATEARELLEQARKQHEGVPGYKAQLDKMLAEKSANGFEAAVKGGIQEWQRSSVKEVMGVGFAGAAVGALAFAISGAGAGAAAGSVVGPEGTGAGAIAGGLGGLAIGSATGFGIGQLALGISKTYQGRERIADSIRSGVTALSNSEAVLGGVGVALDIAAGAIGGAKPLTMGAKLLAREAAEAGGAVTVRGALANATAREIQSRLIKQGVEATQAAVQREGIAVIQDASKAVTSAVRNAGGAAATVGGIGTLGTTAVQTGQAVYQIETSNLSATERATQERQVIKNVAQLGMMIGSTHGANSLADKFSHVSQNTLLNAGISLQRGADNLATGARQFGDFVSNAPLPHELVGRALLAGEQKLSSALFPDGPGGGLGPQLAPAGAGPAFRNLSSSGRTEKKPLVFRSDLENTAPHTNAEGAQPRTSIVSTLEDFVARDVRDNTTALEGEHHPSTQRKHSAELRARLKDSAEGRAPLTAEEHERASRKLAALDRLDAYIKNHEANPEAGTLRTRQFLVVKDFQAFLEEGKTEGYIKLPTGVGKTVIFTELAEALGLRTLVVVPKKILVGQTARSLATFAEDMKFGQLFSEADRASGPQENNITTYASLAKKVKDGSLNPKDYDILILDEAHRALGDETTKAIKQFDNHLKIGFSATPDFTEARRVGNLLPHVISELSIAEAVKEGLLAQFKVIFVKTQTDLSQVETVRREHDAELSPQQVEKAINVETRNNAAVQVYQKMFADQLAVVYCSSIAHSETVAQRFRDQGVEAAVVSGQTPKKEREQILADFHSGKIKVLVNADILIEGFDEPRASVVMNLRPTMSPVVAEQRGGRGLRLNGENPNKAAYVVDFIDDYGTSTNIPITFVDVATASIMLPAESDGSVFKNPQTDPTSSRPQIDIPGISVVVDPREVFAMSRSLQDARNAADVTRLSQRETLLAQGWMPLSVIQRDYPEIVASDIIKRWFHPPSENSPVVSGKETFISPKVLEAFEKDALLIRGFIRQRAQVLNQEGYTWARDLNDQLAGVQLSDDDLRIVSTRLAMQGDIIRKHIQRGHLFGSGNPDETFVATKGVAQFISTTNDFRAEEARVFTEEMALRAKGWVELHSLHADPRAKDVNLFDRFQERNAASPLEHVILGGEKPRVMVSRTTAETLLSSTPAPASESQPVELGSLTLPRRGPQLQYRVSPQLDEIVSDILSSYPHLKKQVTYSRDGDVHFGPEIAVKVSDALTAVPTAWMARSQFTNASRLDEFVATLTTEERALNIRKAVSSLNRYTTYYSPHIEEQYTNWLRSEPERRSAYSDWMSRASLGSAGIDYNTLNAFLTTLSPEDRERYVFTRTDESGKRVTVYSPSIVDRLNAFQAASPQLSTAEMVPLRPMKVGKVLGNKNGEVSPAEMIQLLQELGRTDFFYESGKRYLVTPEAGALVRGLFDIPQFWRSNSGFALANGVNVEQDPRAQKFLASLSDTERERYARTFAVKASNQRITLGLYYSPELAKKLKELRDSE